MAQRHERAAPDRSKLQIHRCPTHRTGVPNYTPQRCKGHPILHPPQCQKNSSTIQTPAKHFYVFHSSATISTRPLPRGIGLLECGDSATVRHHLLQQGAVCSCKHPRRRPSHPFSGVHWCTSRRGGAMEAMGSGICCDGAQRVTEQPPHTYAATGTKTCMCMY